VSVVFLFASAALAGETDVEFQVGSAVVSYNNLDFRFREEFSDQRILDSDDRTTFAYLRVGAVLEHTISDELDVNFDLSHRALWGGDDIGTINAYGGIVYVRALHTDWAPNGGVANDDQEPGSHVLLVRVGRQRFSLGGNPGQDYVWDRSSDYVWDEIGDGIRVDVPLGDVGYVQLVPLSIVSQAGDTANTNWADMKARSETEYNFRGDNLTTRGGVVLVLDGLVEGLDLRPYFVYTDMSAKGSGADISYDGMLGNFADNDYTGNYGVRGIYASGHIAASAEFAGSFGVDRKELIVTDANTSGFAGGAAVVMNTSDPDAGKGGLIVNLDGWYAQGAVYVDNGLLYSHGYVGLKGDQMGGIVSDTLMGWHPSAYSDDIGIEDDQHNRDRKSGSLVAHGGFAYALANGTEFGADAWYMGDTGLSQVDFADVDTLMPPYGYARSEFAAQERLGKPLGIELDVHTNVVVNEHLSFGAGGGILSPGAFYDIPVARVAGDGDDTMLGPNTLGTAPAWAVGVGTELVW
jgi:hypothetical protein